MFAAILVIAIGLLITDKVRPDMVAILVILALAYSHTLSTDEALSGLKSEPAVVIACMFAVFFAAILLPFPRHQATDEAAGAGAEPIGGQPS